MYTTSSPLDTSVCPTIFDVEGEDVRCTIVSSVLELDNATQCF